MILPINKRIFMFRPEKLNKPRLVLIGGCTGTGKSTLGMNIALSEGIMKCVSTDTIRQVIRSYSNDNSIHRSSYSGNNNPINDWLETSNVLNNAILSVVNDAIDRNNSLVLEGVHLQPNSDIINLWKSKGGEALGILLVVTDPVAHQELIDIRGKLARKPATAQIQSFQRIRAIQDHMIQMASNHDWMIVEQNLQPDPVDLVWKYFSSK